MYVCMDVWMYGCMDVWMYGCMDVYIYIYIYIYIWARLKNTVITRLYWRSVFHAKSIILDGWHHFLRHLSQAAGWMLLTPPVKGREQALHWQSYTISYHGSHYLHPLSSVLVLVCYIIVFYSTPLYSTLYMVLVSVLSYRIVSYRTVLAIACYIELILEKRAVGGTLSPEPCVVPVASWIPLGPVLRFRREVFVLTNKQ